MDKQWNKAKLGDYIEINPKEILKKGTISKKISMDKLQPFCKDVPDYELTEFTGGAKFRNGDTIMARITPCLENGKTAMVNVLDKDEIGFGSTEYIVFRSKTGLTDEQFVYYLVCSPIVREPAIKSMVGSSGRQRVQTDVVNNLEINFPPLDAQRNIGNILKAIDDKITLNKMINENLQQQAQAIFSKMFETEDADLWNSGTLSDIAEITMGQSPSGNSYNEDGQGTVFFQGRAEFGFRFPTVRLFTTEPKRMALKNDTLMSVRAPVGDLNIAHEDCCVGRGLAAIRSKDNHQSFVHYTMFSLQKELDVFNGEGTVFGSINRNSLNAMPIKLPPQELIDEFEDLVSPMDALILSNHDATCRLKAIRDALLPKLMSGEFDLSDVQF